MFFFFFSSRRRHTRFKCDWSSDVCSSDLRRGSGGLVTALAEVGRLAPVTWISAAMDQTDRDAARLLRGEDGQEREQLQERVAEQLPGQDLRLVMRELPAEARR